jgi:hypothetical protein
MSDAELRNLESRKAGKDVLAARFGELREQLEGLSAEEVDRLRSCAVLPAALNFQRSTLNAQLPTGGAER